MVAGVDNALNLDAQPTTRAIRAKADTPDEINQMFDGIAYGKAGAVLLTVENYLGEETFRQGVHNYLAAHLYANATAEDFWGAQTATSHKPVDKIMESLVAQPGAPHAHLRRAGQRQGCRRAEALLPQPQHPARPRAEVDAAGLLQDRSQGQDCQLLTPADSTLKAPAGGLFFANAGGKGYYRSAYPPSVYAALVAQVETDAHAQPSASA